MRWDVFCRVVDHHGDVGFAWRLCADLASRGIEVRLWLDARADLAWLAPGRAPGVHVGGWDDAERADPGDAVVETFGCGLPDPFLARMAHRRAPPPWVDVEYLSAEDYVERSHGLPSPRTDGPGAGLVQRYWYPGFTARTGGLVREPGLLEARAAFDAAAWWNGQPPEWRPRPGERAVSLFCYRNPALATLLDDLAGAPTVLYTTAGLASEGVRAALADGRARGDLRVVDLPLLPQREYDRLLWSCDLNFVRGEDSFVRAQWAGVPFVWQAYPQADGVHARKVEAFLDRLLAHADPALGGAVRALWLAWNGLATWPPTWPDPEPWTRLVREWRVGLAARTDLTTGLLAFVAAAR